MTAFDYVVVGAGSSGAVIASRLSEDGKYTVALLEAGSEGAGYIWSRPPGGTVFMIDNGRVNWRYSSEPEEGHGNRPLYVPRGKLLGGTSSINGMIYGRGLPLDYDTWAAQGCHGWSYKDMLPYLKKMESTDVGTDEYRGRRGPVKVTVASKISPFYDLFMKSAESIGLPVNPDYCGANQVGVAMAQQTIYKGFRQSSATQYLNPARGRKNLTVLKGAEATALILEGKRCRGVRFLRNGKPEEAMARREVIVSCGAANSPKLLELSGIGNSDVLARFGIKTIHELKGVGENLREHFAATVRYRFNQGGISLGPKGNGWRLALEAIRYALFRKGFISQGLGTMRVNMRSTPDAEHPDIMMAVAPFIVEVKPGGRGRRMSPIDGFFMITHPQRSEGMGSIHIRSSDPLEPPAIRFKFLSTKLDRELAIASVRQARQIVQAEPLASVIAEELAPGKDVQSDEQILDYFRKTGGTTSHMAGTCKMGNDSMAVVDERLRVHGIKGLRVADASVMPTVISGNPSVPCMALGEKCADMVLSDASEFVAD